MEGMNVLQTNKEAKLQPWESNRTQQHQMDLDTGITHSPWDILALSYFIKQTIFVSYVH